MHTTAWSRIGVAFGVFVAVALGANPAAAATAPFHFSTGDPDGKIATASRIANGGSFEIEVADDFILPGQTSITHLTFTGLLPPGAPLSSIARVLVETYRIFPLDSNNTRTIQVPTRTNSPSDIAFSSADSSAGSLSFEATIVASSFMAANSVQSGGIHPKPNQTTGGNGAVTGEEVLFDVTLNSPLVLPADHYFFVPQVLLSTGDFFWLSAPKPIGSAGTPFTGDLQSWTRDAALDPDWLRVGTDIVGGSTPPTFNGSFSLDGETEVFHFSTGDPDGRMATASRPPSSAFEIETADDFILSGQTSLTDATFTGLLPAGAPLSSISQVVVEFYRVFPNDSDTTRAITVPTRTNSPADMALTSADSVAGTLSFATTMLSPSFTTNNSVQPGGIHAKPNQTTGGNGAVSGQEVRFDVTFTPPVVLPADHYFFIPQVALSAGDFSWLSAPKPIGASGTPFTGDLQSWTRDAALDPDWLRVGTDIVGGGTPPTFNGAFSLDGDIASLEVATPTPGTPTPNGTPTATPPAVTCAGDCTGVGEVTVSNILVLVDIALGRAGPSVCPHGIPSGRTVNVALIVQAVNNAFASCPS